MRDPLVEALAAAVAGHPVRRVPLQELRRAFAQHDPTGATATNSRTRFADALTTLENVGRLVLPKTGRLYETHLQPPLPHWVERPAAPRAPRPAPPTRVWRPELAAAAGLATTPADFDVLTAVDDFLRNKGASRPVVPHRERSVQLFGHEKRLDQLLRGRLFTSGALTLALLRCYMAPLPLTAQHTGDPGPDPELLIVENHATFASVLTLARRRAAAGPPALAVGYGSGNQLPKAIAGITLLDPVPVRLWYFGDLDEGGLITANAAAATAAEEGLPPLQPALPLYERLVAVGVRQKSAGGPVSSDRALKLVASWFGATRLAADIARILGAGERVAQESVGLEELEALPSWTYVATPGQQVWDLS